MRVLGVAVAMLPRVGVLRPKVAPQFPTFMTVRPRSQPRSRPVGLATSDRDSLCRWHLHRYRQGPYQYKVKFLIDGAVPSIELRETVYGFGVNHTAPASSKSVSTSDPLRAADARANSVGRTFQCHVVGAFGIAVHFSMLDFYGRRLGQTLLSLGS